MTRHLPRDRTAPTGGTGRASPVGGLPRTGPRTGQPRTGPRTGQPRWVLSALGACFVVLGGLVAAATGPARLPAGSWLAGYLVLVCGVAQHAMGRAPALLGHPAEPARPAWTLVVLWNLGNTFVITGTLRHTAALVDAGSALLAAGLLVAWRAARPAHRDRAERSRAPRSVALLYHGMLLVLLASLPVGIALAHLRHGW